VVATHRAAVSGRSLADQQDMLRAAHRHRPRQHYPPQRLQQQHEAGRQGLVSRTWISHAAPAGRPEGTQQPACTPSTPYEVHGPPTISLAEFTSWLTLHGSPAIVERPASEYYGACVKAGIDPNFALAQFWHESQAGTDGIAKVTKSWGNLATPVVMPMARCLVLLPIMIAG
jgi:hypothetical protein